MIAVIIFYIYHVRSVILNSKRFNLEAVGLELDPTGAVKVTSYLFHIVHFVI